MLFLSQAKVVTRHLSTESTCPETPDSSSIKEEAYYGDAVSPALAGGGGGASVGETDTGSYTCMWADCKEEFYSQKTLVEHVNDSHMETRKGCEEFPCLWKVGLASCHDLIKVFPDKTSCF